MGGGFSAVRSATATWRDPPVSQAVVLLLRSIKQSGSLIILGWMGVMNIHHGTAWSRLNLQGSVYYSPCTSSHPAIKRIVLALPQGERGAEAMPVDPYCKRILVTTLVTMPPAESVPGAPGCLHLQC
jgi:hypothetical protein